MTYVEYRYRNNLSQSQLSKISGLNLRSIQQAEFRGSEISKDKYYLLASVEKKLNRLGYEAACKSIQKTIKDFQKTI